MATTDPSTETEIAGQLVDVIHVDNSGTDPVRTVLALATKDDLSVSFDEGTESFDVAIERRTKRFRTSNQIDVEITKAISTDLSALDTLGVVDSSNSGAIDFSDASRELGTDVYIELGFHADELDYTTDPGPTDYDQTHRLSDVETMLNDIDPSAVPPTVALTLMVEGDYEMDAAAL
jgi:hypothetical protein